MQNSTDPLSGPSTSSSRTLWLWVLSAVWAVIVAGGLSVVWTYDNTPGDAGQTPRQWPTGTTISRASDRPTLVLFAHPQCSCTRASLSELAEALARAGTQPKTYVVFLKPYGFGTDWEKTDLWQTASRLPHVTVIRDDEGIEAERFGAITSGQTVLYDNQGTLLFSGGITGARGHAGNNAGRASLVALLNQGKAERSWTSVFGCRLFTFIS